MIYNAKAFAKINLFLDVVGKRPDGYHDLDTVMQSVSLFDEVSLELTDCGVSVFCDRDDISGEENIAYKACVAFIEFAGLECGVRVSIRKNIPLAAGLGGGSADAAAVLVLMNRASGKNYRLEELVPLAAKLGADVPFFLYGGTARAKGIGDVLSRHSAPEMHYVLIKEGEKQSTGKMYSLLDSTSYLTSGNVERMVLKLEQNDILSASKEFFNAFSFCWDFEKLSAPFSDFSPLSIFLSGSGPTVCALFENKDAAESCAGVLSIRGFNAYAVSSTDTGVFVE